MTKIALLGSAPSSLSLAPFDDPSWKIWACSPGAFPHVKRCEAYFELHRWEVAPWFGPEYIGFLTKLTCPVYMIHAVPEIPASVAYPNLHTALEKWGPHNFTSSLALMFALAVEQGATEIGLWGVDMAADEEWEGQRQALQNMIWFARRYLGIKVFLPSQSDLARPPVIYGFCEVDHMHQKLMVRKAELMARYHNAMRAQQDAQNEICFIQGAVSDISYMLKTWVNDPYAVELALNASPLEQGLPPAQEETHVDVELAKPKRSRRKANGTRPAVLAEAAE